MQMMDQAAPPPWPGGRAAGEILLANYMVPLSISTEALATALHVPVGRISDAITGKEPIDAELDLRLSRYVGTSPGFFLRFQMEHDLEAAKSKLEAELRLIVPR